ncbi:hypothetical protein M0813_13670 [Anaeramoeba flamelloides]|uniref:Uncharacterized protein n=1 Tax=Anaeramoeba flamelloides TaxID=1746091 RepID=A0ABQ8Z7V2_9EUKA|nr:hypothetical protein M0813_13670 [Anaeramoeba flamelloides]
MRRYLNEKNHQNFSTQHTHCTFPRYHQLGFEKNDPNEENFDKEIHKKQEVSLTWIMLFQKQFEETLLLLVMVGRFIQGKTTRTKQKTREPLNPFVVN